MKFIDTKPSLTNADINEFETTLGFALPSDLREHYLAYNGGQPVPRFFPKGDEVFAVEEFLPIKFGIRRERFEDAYQDIVVGNDLFPSKLIPFANDAGGDYFCYSLRDRAEGSVVFYQSEYYDDPSRCVVTLSRSLNEFLASLVDE